MRQLYPPGQGGTDGGVDLAAAYAYPPQPAGRAAAWVRANMVTSTDGATAVNGVSGPLSGEADRALFWMLRGLADVILVGARTVRAERYGPARAHKDWARLRAGRPPLPPIAIVTGHLDLDLSSPLFTVAPAYARTIVFTCDTAPPDRRARAEKWADVVIAGSRRVDLAAVVNVLAGRGLHRVLAEGGPHLLGQLVTADLLDELCVTVSPLLAGGDTARLTAGAELAEPRRLRLGHVLEAQDTLFCRYVRTRS
ncbi:MAG TPA: pyrimidine reductase family protein [Streptosporangiaceae bacterium]|nr:pyrimidine reductase family protein [Streptosporangiaceae bacterium]